MEKYSNEELLDMLPVQMRESKELTKKQKVLLGQLRIYGGLTKKDEEGYFFRSNRDLCADCEMTEHTLISAVRKLVLLELILTKRSTGRSEASYYKVLEDNLKDYCKTDAQNCSNETLGLDERIRELEITVKNLNRNCSKDCSTETEKDLEIDKDIEIIINNILRYTSKETLKKKLEVMLEETVSEKELVSEAEAEIPVSSTEQTASTSVDSPSQASPVTERTSSEDAVIPTEADSTPVTERNQLTSEELYQQCFVELEPILNEYGKASTLQELDNLVAQTVQSMREFCQAHQLEDDSLFKRIAGVIAERQLTSRDRILAANQPVLRMLQFQSSQLS